MSKYKYLVLTDLDGTLLNSSGRISAFSLDYVHRINKRDDVLFSFSTGRSWKDAERIYEELQIKGFVSCCNGAHIYDPHQDMNIYGHLSYVIWEHTLANDSFFNNLKIGDVLTDKGTYVIEPDTDRVALMAKLKEDRVNVFSLKLYFHQTCSHESDVEEVDARVRFLQELELAPYLTIYHYPQHKTIDFEIQAPGVSKEKAVRFLSNYYGISEKNIITFGDQLNDLPVTYGTSFFVSVKNAIDLVKHGSQKLSEFSNDEDAVVKETELFLEARGIK